ncbi:type IX secretion system sortase PorU [Altibacter sp. HG106]|uniref:type IX secretion system sortase PorU n=1 Tax=Altibacter sp. HG106 TaxID=3023937 RepID=UPI00234FE8C2|nr:type IX secretion system sortase PorU [Altibacter sp. HG106]MDC7995945.1 type IX secretion system sortase PorU [Altibacter sp. HG106]
MRKSLLVVVFFLFLLPIVAQQRSVTIDWSRLNPSATESATKTSANPSEILTTRESVSQSLHVDEFQLAFYYHWRDNAWVAPNSLQLTNVRYESVTAAERAAVNETLVPTSITASISTSSARDVLHTQLMISPIVRRNGSLQKVVSFDFTVSYGGRSSIGTKMPLSNSVLANGVWFKFRIDKSGVYQLDRSFLERLGMNVGSINPRNLKIYGHGGKPLPLANDLNDQIDLPEVAIKVVGEADNSFDSGDFILFYGEGTQGYVEENDSHLNPYSDETYYYITADGGPGLRVRPMNEPSGAGTPITTFNDALFFEEDEFSPSLVGRQWYGNRFDIESEQSFTFTIPNIVSSVPTNIIIRAAATSESITSMAVSVNGTSLDPLNFGATSQSFLLSIQETTAEVPLGTEEITVDMTYNNSGNPSSVAYLDYIRIETMRALAGVAGQLSFRYNDAATSSGVGEYQIANAAQFSEVWDVTQPASIVVKEHDGSGSLTFKANLGEIREYVAVNPSDYFTPIEIPDARVPNQNLKGSVFNATGGGFQDVDYLIVAPPIFIQPALRLADHHRNHSGLRVKVVTTDKIYQEFSSGKQDISAIRNFVKYIYDNASNAENRIKYVGFFGDTSVDYKNRLPGNNNMVPTYHELIGSSSVQSYMSDDFFGMIDSGEGTMLSNDRLDIAVGRILADNVTLANQMVDKIIGYSSNAAYGNWRNNFVLVSDDVDEVYEYEDIEVTLDALGDQIEAEIPFVNVKKIHSDAFQQETSAGGNRYPAVTEAIENAIDVGSLVMTYLGHGGEDGLAKEFIFTKTIAQELKNTNRYPCIVTVTCEFSKFDNPLRVTAGELTYWNPDGGAITLITTTRSINVSVGVDFNQQLAPFLFGFETPDYPTPAEALRLAKANINAEQRRVAFCVGDPALKLAFPKNKIELTTINGIPIEASTDTLQALSKVRLGGVVTDPAGNVLTDYNGVLEAKVFDKYVDRQTLGNDGVRDPTTNELLILNYRALGEGLFNGQATVANGAFEFEFVVPRDIQIPVGNGRVSLYSVKENFQEDQTGVNLTINVGGLNEDAPEDNVGPTVRLFMNDESFTSGGVTNDSPILIAKLEDENGINTASGIGHDMIAILDGDEVNPVILNEYYQSDVDDFTRGTASYQLRDLEEGLHTLTLKAWDVYNNSSTQEIQFVVAGDDELKITRVLNYPNPFVNYTEFWFNHNRPFEPLEVQVQVFTVTGKVVWTKNQLINTDGFLSRDIVWDGRDDFGDRIGKGVYVYKITVKSTLTNQRVEKFEKLVIL